MTAKDFTRLALALEGAEQGSHMGTTDFRVGGRIFATLAHVQDGYGNLMLTPEVQTQFVEDAPDLFLPVHGGWGRGGATHIRLAAATREQLAGALEAAWRLRVEKNRAVARPRARRSATEATTPTTGVAAAPTRTSATRPARPRAARTSTRPTRG